MAGLPAFSVGLPPRARNHVSLAGRRHRRQRPHQMELVNLVLFFRAPLPLHPFHYRWLTSTTSCTVLAPTLLPISPFWRVNFIPLQRLFLAVCSRTLIIPLVVSAFAIRNSQGRAVLSPSSCYLTPLFRSCLASQNPGPAHNITTNIPVCLATTAPPTFANHDPRAQFAVLDSHTLFPCFDDTRLAPQHLTSW